MNGSTEREGCRCCGRGGSGRKETRCAFDLASVFLVGRGGGRELLMVESDMCFVDTRHTTRTIRYVGVCYAYGVFSPEFKKKHIIKTRLIECATWFRCG